MEPYQERIVDEHWQLAIRIAKLRSFLDGELSAALPAEERERMERQHGIMKQYQGVLQERVRAFPTRTK